MYQSFLPCALATEPIECGSIYSVKSHGSIDDSLLNEYIDKVILPLHPSISKIAAFEPTTGKLHHLTVLRSEKH